jgi:hypothetical protein
MHDVGAGWLMSELSPSPFGVAAVQSATTLPVLLFALVAGAIADIVNRRKLLIAVNGLMALAATMLAILASLNRVTPLVLLLFTFLLGTGAAFIAPTWQAIGVGFDAERSHAGCHCAAQVVDSKVLEPQRRACPADGPGGGVSSDGDVAPRGGKLRRSGAGPDHARHSSAEWSD